MLLTGTVACYHSSFFGRSRSSYRPPYPPPPRILHRIHIELGGVTFWLQKKRETAKKREILIPGTKSWGHRLLLYCYCFLLQKWCKDQNDVKLPYGMIFDWKLLHFFEKVYTGRGHSHFKGVWGCAAVMTPFFQAIRCSLAYQFTVNAPLLWLPFSSFRKFSHFQPCMFWPKFYLSRPKENPLLRPYILKPPWHTSTRKSWVPSPGV